VEEDAQSQIQKLLQQLRLEATKVCRGRCGKGESKGGRDEEEMERISMVPILEGETSECEKRKSAERWIPASEYERYLDACAPMLLETISTGLTNGAELEAPSGEVTRDSEREGRRATGREQKAKWRKGKEAAGIRWREEIACFDGIMSCSQSEHGPFEQAKSARGSPELSDLPGPARRQLEIKL
jgi:hypothetical protein